MLHLLAAFVMAPNSTHVRLPRDGKRDLELRVTWPQDSGSHPLLIFSHGFRGSMDSYDPLVNYWAEHGFVVIQPNHADSLQYVPKNERLQALLPRPGSFANWSERPQEISLIIDRLDEVELQVPALQGRIDRSRIGVGGHSFGAHTGQLIAGARTRLGQSFKDPRVKAVLLISPQGRGNSFGNDAWKEVTGPLMVITGSKDESITRTTPEERKEPFVLSPAGDKYLLWIDGAYHGFGGITGRPFPTAGPPNADQVALVQQTSLDFFRAYIIGDEQARLNLNPSKIAAFPNVNATLSKR